MAGLISSMINNTLFNKIENQKTYIPLQEKQDAPDDEDIDGDGGDYSLDDEEGDTTDEDSSTSDEDNTDDNETSEEDTSSSESDEVDSSNTDDSESDDNSDDSQDTDTTSGDDGDSGSEDIEGGDYSLDGDSTEDTNTDEENPDNEQDNSDDENEDNTDDSEEDNVLLGKKLKLVEAMSSLYNSISTILIELNIISPNTKEEREIYNNIVETLTDTREAIYNYILLKYSRSKYEENLIAFYSFEASIEICKELLSKMKDIRNTKNH